ncbi:hypothetical protein TNCV_37721 [Trichonephila clavipes]|nr:hypothetical protein TNCV_37721 [Trichonephila clavipes]
MPAAPVSSKYEVVRLILDGTDKINMSSSKSPHWRDVVVCRVVPARCCPRHLTEAQNTMSVTSSPRIGL